MKILLIRDTTVNGGTADLAVKPYIHTEVYFNELDANGWRDNMGMGTKNIIGGIQQLHGPILTQF